MEPSTVPNVHFGQFGLRHSIRMFFPRLKTDERVSVRLTAEELQPLYDTVIRPAVALVMPEIVCDWPGSFSTAEWKDRNSRRGFSHSSYLIPKERMQHFSQEIRHIINNNRQLKWARDFFWGVEIRGVKNECSHPITSTDVEATQATNLVLRQVDTTIGTWYGDIGLEFMLTNQALVWSTNGHRDLLMHMLGIPREEADAVISNPRCYSRDITTHVMALSGFRAKFSHHQQGLGAGPMFVAYAQAYQTDKQQTYHPEKSRFGKTLSAKVAVQGNPPLWCQSLLRVYDDAAKRVNVATRFEARIPIQFIGDALRRVDLAIIKRLMVCYKRELWW